MRAFGSLRDSFLFLQKNKKDVINFDHEFTKEEPVLTPIAADVVRSINQNEFVGFSFVNPDYDPSKFCPHGDTK